MLSRRKFLKSGLLFGAGVLLPPGIAMVSSPKQVTVQKTLNLSTATTRHRKMGHQNSVYAKAAAMPAAAIPGGTLDPESISKFVTPLVIPPAMPRTRKIQQRRGKNIDYYEIAVRQFQQQILPAGMPATTVWSYGSVNHPGTFNYPAFTIEAKYNAPVRVKWINDLKDASGNYLPHLLPVDPTLHWANPPGGEMGRDMRPTFTETPGPYTGPVPVVTHVHGAHTTDESDGYAEAWYLPAAANIPSGYATEGTFYNYFKGKALTNAGVTWAPGSSTFTYPNDQAATTLWYHDHTLGMTRLNVYAGPAGFYLLRGGPTDVAGGVLPGPAPAQGDPAGMKYYEIPLAIQDRSFNDDGSLFFPNSREFFDGATATEPGFIPGTDLSPIWNPEFFGNTMLVNGNTWPFQEVEQRRYRFRLLNGCNSRFLILDFNQIPGVEVWQIGSDGGFLPAPVNVTALSNQILLAPAERADVIVDFTNVPLGNYVLGNLGPDEPFGGGVPGTDFLVADPGTTGQVMEFRVVPAISADTSVHPSLLALPALAPLVGVPAIRQVSLNEMMSKDFDGPSEALLGTMENGEPVHQMWDDPITENPGVGDVEEWEIYNFTADAHPIHIHQIMFQVVNRETLVLDSESGEAVLPAQLTGVVRPPEATETGFKDTVISYPGEVTRVRMQFDLPGLYVWHCHIVDHEDNEMMRPFHVGPVDPGLPL